MDDEETKKASEMTQAEQNVRRLKDALDVVIQEQEALVSLQEQMTEALRALKAGADKIRSGCDSFNAEMEKHGIGTQRTSQAVGVQSYLEGWTPPKAHSIH